MQYDGNRSVIVGIIVSGKSFTNELCGKAKIRLIRISYFIEWILYIIDSIEMQRPINSIPIPIPIETVAESDSTDANLDPEHSENRCIKTYINELNICLNFFAILLFFL